MFLLYNAASCITILHKKKVLKFMLSRLSRRNDYLLWNWYWMNKKCFYLPSEEWTISWVFFFVSFFFQREYYVVYQEINLNQSNRRSPVINICRGRILTSLYPVNGFLSSCIKWFEAKTKTPIDTATVKSNLNHLEC